METWRASLSLSWYKDGGYGFHWELPSIRWGCLCWRSRAHARPLFPSCICACSVSPPWPPLFRHHACMEHAKWVCVSPFLLFSLPETTWYLFLDSNLCAFSFDITIESINCQIFFASPRVWFALNLRVCYSWNQSSIITSKQAPLSTLQVYLPAFFSWWNTETLFLHTYGSSCLCVDLDVGMWATCKWLHNS